MPDIRKQPKARVELEEITTGPTDEFDLMLEEVENGSSNVPRDLNLGDFEIPDDLLSDLPDDRVLQSNVRAKEMLNEALRPQTQNNVSSFIRGVGSGGTFGASDEIAGRLSQALPSSVRRTLGEMSAPEGASREKRERYGRAAEGLDYEDVRDMARRQYQTSFDEDPLATIGGELAGTAASAYLTRGAGRGRSGATVGAVEGGLEGFNRSEGRTARELARDTALGTSIGAGVGRVVDSLAGRTGARAGERPVRDLVSDQVGAINLKALARMRSGEFGPEAKEAADRYFWAQARANRETSTPIGTSPGALASPEEVLQAEDALQEVLQRGGLSVSENGDISRRVGQVPEGAGSQGRLFDEPEFEPVTIRARGRRDPQAQMTVRTKPKKRGARGAEGADIGSGSEPELNVDLADLEENLPTRAVYEADTRVVDPEGTRMAEYGEQTNAIEDLGELELMLRTLDQAALRDQARYGREVDFGRTQISRPTLEEAFEEGGEPIRQRAAQSGYAVRSFPRPEPEVGGPGAIEGRVTRLPSDEMDEFDVDMSGEFDGDLTPEQINQMYSEAYAAQRRVPNERAIPAQLPSPQNEQQNLIARGMEDLYEEGRQRARERTGRYTQEVSSLKVRLARAVNEGESPAVILDMLRGRSITLPELRAYLEQLDWEGALDSRRLMRVLAVIDAEVQNSVRAISRRTSQGRRILPGDLEPRSPIARDIQETMEAEGIEPSMAGEALDQRLYPRPLNRAMIGRGPVREQEWQREIQRMYQEGMSGRPTGSRRTPRQEPQAQDERPPGSRQRPRARADQGLIDETQERLLDDYSRSRAMRRAKGLPMDADSEMREATEIIDGYISDADTVIENIENELMIGRGLDVGRALIAARRKYQEELAAFEEADELLDILERAPGATERQIARLDAEVQDRFYRAQRAGLIEDVLKVAHQRVGRGQGRYFPGEEPETTEGIRRLGRRAAPVQTREPE